VSRETTARTPQEQGSKVGAADLVELLGGFGFALGLGGETASLARKDVKLIAQQLEDAGRTRDAAIVRESIARIEAKVWQMLQAAAEPSGKAH
jgi:hypothetical protein